MGLVATSVAGLMTLLVLLVSLEGADASQKKFQARVSGSLVSTTIDTDGAGSNAVLTILEGSSSVGGISAQGVGEWRNLVAPVSCPAGNVEATIVTARGVLRSPDGDLLFTGFSSGTSCTDLATGITTFSTDGSFVGGTGRFERATGALHATGTVRILLADPNGNVFGATTTETEGTLVTPTP